MKCEKCSGLDKRDATTKVAFTSNGKTKVAYFCRYHLAGWSYYVANGTATMEKVK